MKTKKNKAAIFVDLDGTLIWTWTPLITSAFMSAVFGLPICTPPKPEDGNIKLVKVPIENKYALSCCRPNVRPFLRDLRSLAEVCLLTHASRDYALAMNRVFQLGFPEQQIFSLHRVRQGVGLPMGNFVLIDDEACSSDFGDYGTRHREKCQVLDLKGNSSRVVAVTPFAGRRDDYFTRRNVRRSIWYRVRIALNLWPGDRKRAAVYERVIAGAEAVFGSKEAAHSWIATPQRALGMRTPLSHLERDAGASEVLSALGAPEGYGSKSETDNKRNTAKS